MKILKEPVVELVIRPTINWQSYAKFLKSNFGIDEPMGLSLDEMSKYHASGWHGDAIPMVCAKSCYKAWATGRKNIKDYLEHILESGHGSVLEHANFGFVIITTRAITHEIVRHRAGFAFSQESQRFCDEKDNAFIMPLSIQGNQESENAWVQQIQSALDSYIKVTDLLNDRYSSDSTFSGLSKTDLRKKVREASRGLLPNDTASVIHVTANIRALRHFIEMRANRHAEAGIRIVANKMYDIMIKECPILFSDYTKEELPDGTYHIEAKAKKV